MAGQVWSFYEIVRIRRTGLCALSAAWLSQYGPMQGARHSRMHFCEGLAACLFYVYSTSDIPTQGFQLDILGVLMVAAWLAGRHSRVPARLLGPRSYR